MAPKAAQKKGAKAPLKKDIKKDRFKRSDEGMVDADVEVDEEKRYTGVVTNFQKQRGFGFIKLDDTGIVDKDEVMVYWKEITSDERWPALQKDMKVELGLKKFTKHDGSGAFIKAKEVTAIGGGGIEMDGEDKKEYVGGDKNLRFTGKVIWFDWKKGFGFVKLDDGYDTGDHEIKDIRIPREEINCGDDAPRLKDSLEVEFGISKNLKGTYSVYNLTLPGGDPVLRATVENRKSVGNTMYKGDVRSFMGGVGWIEPKDVSGLPKDFQTKLTEFTEKRSKKADKEKDAWLFFRKQDCADTSVRVDRGMACTFKLYTDNQGVGAFNVTF